MSDKAGVWIDHRKALIVTINAAGEHLTRVVSKIDKHLQRGGDSPLHGSYESQQVSADSARQRALTRDLDVYYDAVIAVLGASHSLLIFGPGEAKGELSKRLLARIPLAARTTAVETADKMTDPQIVARVRTFFGTGSSRVR